MEKDFYKDELEVFLQQKADEYSMYPSEKVWNGVKNNLFWRKHRLSFTASALLLCLLFFIPESFLNNIFRSSTTSKPAKGGSTTTVPLFNKPGWLTAIRGNLLAAPFVNAPVTSNTPKVVTTSIGNNDKQEPAKLYPVKSAAVSSRTLHPDNSVDISSAITFKNPVTAENDSIQTAATGEEPEQYHADFNWLQELAVIKLSPKKQSRFNLQFYFSPLVSYRTLTDNDYNTHSRQGSPLTANQLDINRYVDHQPSIGVELGSNLLYKASKNLTFKTGLQLNYSRYTIKAYKVGYEKASIALNTAGHTADTITSYTTLRNFDGYVQEQLQNQYLQLSVPIGAELKLLGNKRLQLNIAGSIQPTLLLLNDTYLLSTDYINYTKEPTLVRKWNVHSSAEAYISYQFANVRWQVGPQFRYQLLSSFNDRYPIKEYLMEYGIKFGISKTLR